MAKAEMTLKMIISLILFLLILLLGFALYNMAYDQQLNFLNFGEEAQDPDNLDSFVYYQDKITLDTKVYTIFEDQYEYW